MPHVISAVGTVGCQMEALNLGRQPPELLPWLCLHEAALYVCYLW